MPHSIPVTTIFDFRVALATSISLRNSRGGFGNSNTRVYISHTTDSHIIYIEPSNRLSIALINLEWAPYITADFETRQSSWISISVSLSPAIWIFMNYILMNIDDTSQDRSPCAVNSNQCTRYIQNRFSPFPDLANCTPYCILWLIQPSHPNGQ